MEIAQRISSENTIVVACDGDIKLFLTHEKQTDTENKDTHSEPVLKKRKAPGDESNTESLTKTFLVSSAVMCLASKVWRAMLHSGSRFTEAQILADTCKQAHFYDDDPEALLILLSIAHLAFRKVPVHMEWSLLLNMAVLCDKYDTVSITRPWLTQWVEPVLPLAKIAPRTGYE